MWLKRFTNYLLQHRWQAIMLTFVISFIPVIGLFGILIAAFITLCKGVVEGAIATLAATLPCVVIYAVTNNVDDALFLVNMILVGMAVLSNVLTWVFAVALRRQVSWAMLIQVAALLGVLAVSIVHLVYPNVAGWWGAELKTFAVWWANQLQAYNQAAGIAKSTTAGLGDMQVEWINYIRQFATGFIVAFVIFVAVTQLIAARWWQAIVFNPGSLRRELHNIRLSQLAGGLFIASIVLYYFGNSVILDIMPILYMLFGAAGLSLVHYLFGLMHSPTVWFWLAVFYISLVLVIPTPINLIVISFVGLLDIWVDVRKRVRKI